MFNIVESLNCVLCLILVLLPRVWCFGVHGNQHTTRSFSASIINQNKWRSKDSPRGKESCQSYLTLQSFKSVGEVQISSLSVGGSDPDSAGKVNQDVCFHFQTERFICCGVLDGHGKKGHDLNAFFKSYIPTLLQEKLKEMHEPSPFLVHQTLIEAFEISHLAARSDINVPAGRSGTTCVVTIFDTNNGKIYTGNVGDSRSIVGIGNMTCANEWFVKALSQETTTSREEERQRIEGGEGRIDSGGNVWYGPIGIAMTRALGDSVMTRAGVISTPEITEFDLKTESRSNCSSSGWIVLASDGIFDVMSNDEVVVFLDESICASTSIHDACASLVDEARKRWQKGLPMEVRIDDITVVVLNFRLHYD